ncbi:MAG: acylglycerol kinase family protein, partial [Candidatus Methanomethylophilaceae archaeon]|nr:acylglycerol kinase family protein [Candidatus Methanomethylophilaceae archaeon]
MIGIIFNPASNSGNSQERMKTLLALLDEKGSEYVYRETSGPGNATEIAKELASSCSVVVAAGGDGTVFEVANGMYGTDAALMIFPLGSGNDIARSAKVNDLDDQALVDTVVAGKTRPFDCFTVDGKIGMEFVTFNLVVNIISRFKDPANAAKGYGGV